MSEFINSRPLIELVILLLIIITFMFASLKLILQFIIQMRFGPDNNGSLDDDKPEVGSKVNDGK